MTGHGLDLFRVLGRVSEWLTYLLMAVLIGIDGVVELHHRLAYLSGSTWLWVGNAVLWGRCSGHSREATRASVAWAVNYTGHFLKGGVNGTTNQDRADCLSEIGPGVRELKLGEVVVLDREGKPDTTK